MYCILCFVIEHGTLKKHLNTLDVPHLECRFCGKYTETAEHLGLLKREVLDQKRILIFGPSLTRRNADNLSKQVLSFRRDGAMLAGLERGRILKVF